MAKNDTAASRPARAPPADDASNRPTDGTSSTATGAATAAGTAGDGVDGRGGGIDKATAVEDDEEFDPTFNPWAAEAEDVLDPDDDGAMVVETTPVQPASKRTKTKHVKHSSRVVEQPAKRSKKKRDQGGKKATESIDWTPDFEKLVKKFENLAEQIVVATLGEKRAKQFFAERTRTEPRSSAQMDEYRRVVEKVKAQLQDELLKAGWKKEDILFVVDIGAVDAFAALCANYATPEDIINGMFGGNGCKCANAMARDGWKNFLLTAFLDLCQVALPKSSTNVPLRGLPSKQLFDLVEKVGRHRIRLRACCDSGATLNVHAGSQAHTAAEREIRAAAAQRGLVVIPSSYSLTMFTEEDVEDESAEVQEVATQSISIQLLSVVDAAALEVDEAGVPMKNAQGDFMIDTSTAEGRCSSLGIMSLHMSACMGPYRGLLTQFKACALQLILNAIATAGEGRPVHGTAIAIAGRPTTADPSNRELVKVFHALGKAEVAAFKAQPPTTLAAATALITPVDDIPSPIQEWMTNSGIGLDALVPLVPTSCVAKWTVAVAVQIDGEWWTTPLGGQQRAWRARVNEARAAEGLAPMGVAGGATRSAADTEKRAAHALTSAQKRYYGKALLEIVKVGAYSVDGKAPHMNISIFLRDGMKARDDMVHLDFEKEADKVAAIRLLLVEAGYTIE